MAEHCRHARYVWNLAVEQQLHWQPGRRAPGYKEQSAQLTAARAEYDWLAAGCKSCNSARCGTSTRRCAIFSAVRPVMPT